MTVSKQSTKDLIADSLVDLASQGHNIRKITVQSIAANCGVSKRTFYYYFKDKYDVVAWDFIRGYKPLFVEHMDNGDYHGMLKASLDYLVEHHEYFENLFKNTEGFDSVTSTIALETLGLYEEYYTEKYGSEVLSEYIRFNLRFSCMACIDAMARWLFDGTKQSTEELATWLTNCLPNDLRPLLMGEDAAR